MLLASIHQKILTSSLPIDEIEEEKGGGNKARPLEGAIYHIRAAPFNASAT